MHSNLASLQRLPAHAVLMPVLRRAVTIVQFQLAVRESLARRRDELGAAISESASWSARWNHDRSMMALQSTLKAEDEDLKGPTNSSANALQMMAQTVTGMVGRMSKTAYTELDMATTEAALVEHCGWLLMKRRTLQRWKVRWMLLQAGYLWYFKDCFSCRQGRPLGRVRLGGLSTIEEGPSPRQLAVKSEQSTLFLTAANEIEAR